MSKLWHHESYKKAYEYALKFDFHQRRTWAKSLNFFGRTTQNTSSKNHQWIWESCVKTLPLILRKAQQPSFTKKKRIPIAETRTDFWFNGATSSVTDHNLVYTVEIYLLHNYLLQLNSPLNNNLIPSPIFPAGRSNCCCCYICFGAPAIADQLSKMKI